MKVWLVVVGVALCGCSGPGVVPPPGYGAFEREVVAADHGMASEAGAEVLRAGGNAVDAAVATSFALSVVRPYSCGIGGGGFMVIHLPADPVHGAVTTSINYRETAPGRVGADFYEDEGRSSVRGGTAVGVPGTVAGLLYALDRYGMLDRATVMAPAIRVAEEGFAADAHFVKSSRDLIAWFREDAARQARFSFVWERYLREGEVAVGDVIRNPEQASALRLIARDGASAFYEGDIGAAIVGAVAGDGGVMTAGDLAGYAAVEQAPLRFRFAARETRSEFIGDDDRVVTDELITMGPPSSGGIAMAEVLGILDRIGFEGLLAGSDETSGSEDPGASRAARDFVYARRVATVVEAMKHAFADRARWLGDPAQVDVPVGWLLSDERLDGLAAKMTPGQPQEVDWYGSVAPAPDDGGTSHFCVADRWGGVVSCTETINLEFGSLLAVDAFGFVLNDEMDDFTARPGEPNAFGLVQSALNSPAPGKRPLSSMSPSIVLDEDGRVLAAMGASGGPRIISSTLETLLETVARSEPVIDWFPAPGFYLMYYLPRFHDQWLPDVVFVEMEPAWADIDVDDDPMGARLSAALEGMGYEVRPSEEIGNVQYIVKMKDGWIGVCDPRKGGEPAGE